MKIQYPELSPGEIEVKILSGEVFVCGERIRDKNRLVKFSSPVEWKSGSSFVSRGGEKLEYILKAWNITVRDKIWLDAGASTGGFSDCLLKEGAKLIYAVDVGYNQLAYSLRRDERVVVWERTNIRNITPESFTSLPDAAVCDLSFRSIRGVAGHILKLVISNTLLALVKPQFEYVNPPPEFAGVVKTDKELVTIVSDLIYRLEEEGVFVQRMDLSPIRGQKGNREFFFLLTGKRVRTAAASVAMLGELVAGDNAGNHRGYYAEG